MSEARIISTMVVDDDALVRLALTDLLATDAGIEVVAQASDGLQAVEEAAAHRVDVALMDVRMPRLDGIAAIARLRALPHAPRIITLTTFDLDEYVYEALAAGADGFLLKDSEIAGGLRMSESTVKAHVSRILTTLEVGNRVQAALAARDAGPMPDA